MDEKLAPLTEVRTFFGYKTLTEFKNDWTKLSDKDRHDIRSGIGNGSLTY